LCLGLYGFKALYHFDVVKKEFFHPVRSNFLLGAPILASMVIIVAEPSYVADYMHPGTQVTKGAYVFLAFLQLLVDLYLYGRWWRGDVRSFSMVNPTYQLAIVCNFFTGLLGAGVSDPSWKRIVRDVDLFYFSVGMVFETAVVILCFFNMHQLKVDGVNWFDRKNHALHYSLFLFMAPPAVASICWEKIGMEYGYGSKILTSISFMFMFFCLRFTPMFIGKLGLSSWAITFPRKISIGFSLK
jgi:hypothetical protein